MCIITLKKESWGVLVRLGVSSGSLGRPGVIRLIAGMIAWSEYELDHFFL